MSTSRIFAIFLEHFLRLIHEFTEIVETFYWAIMDVVIWGFMTAYISKLGQGGELVISLMLGGLILWTIAWRTQQDISLSMMRDIWNKNLISLFTTPLTVWEFMTGSIILGTVKIFLTIGVASGVALVFYKFNILTMGIYFIPFILNLLLFGWNVALFVNSLIIRFGTKIENFAWGFIILLQPLAAVYYPVSSLPGFLQVVSRMVPASHVFEGMRQVYYGGLVSTEHLVWATVLNIIYLGGNVIFFNFMFQKARELGKIVRLEE